MAALRHPGRGIIERPGCYLWVWDRPSAAAVVTALRASKVLAPSELTAQGWNQYADGEDPDLSVLEIPASR